MRGERGGARLGKILGCTHKVYFLLFFKLPAYEWLCASFLDGAWASLAGSKGFEGQRNRKCRVQGSFTSYLARTKPALQGTWLNSGQLRFHSQFHPKVLFFLNAFSPQSSEFRVLGFRLQGFWL